MVCGLYRFGKIRVWFVLCLILSDVILTTCSDIHDPQPSVKQVKVNGTNVKVNANDTVKVNNKIKLKLNISDHGQAKDDRLKFKANKGDYGKVKEHVPIKGKVTECNGTESMEHHRLDMDFTSTVVGNGKLICLCHGCV